jgi:hypothetical protein
MVVLLFSSPSDAIEVSSVSLSPDRDTSLFEDGDAIDYESNSNGIGNMLYVGETNRQGSRRSLLGFDIAGNIPRGSTIVSATLTLTVAKEPSTPVDPYFLLYAVTTPWGEGASEATGGEGVPAALGDATWVASYFDPSGTTTEIWTTPGGDYRQPVSDNGSEVETDIWVFTRSTMADDVQSWLDSPEDNHGWILLGNELLAFTARAFHSREATEEVDRPVLVVEYVPEPSAAPMTLAAAVTPGALAYARRRYAKKCSGLPRARHSSSKVVGDLPGTSRTQGSGA